MKKRTIIIDDESLARDRIRGFLNAYADDVSIVAEAENGLKGLELIRTHQPDFVFLDIQMPEMDGFAMLKALESEDRPGVIFTTAYDEYAVKAFEVHALDYLLKPFSKGRFADAMQRVMEKGPSSSELQARLDSLLSTIQRPGLTRLSIKDQGRVYFVPLDQIDWIESAGNYVVIHTADRTHIMRETMASLERQLPVDEFMRVSRSAIVRLSAVTEVRSVSKGENHVILDSGASIKASTNLKELQVRLEQS